MSTVPYIPPQEYVREKNVNTTVYWNRAHKRNIDVTPASTKVAIRLAEVMTDLPALPVVEYGFGTGHFARLMGPHRWQGVEFSERAVNRLKGEGYLAELGRCGDAVVLPGCYVVALEVLEHLDRAEMETFLERCQAAEMAFYSVPIPKSRDLRFPQHMRSFGIPRLFGEFLRGYWPKVEVEKVGLRWMLARCSR